MALGRKKFTNVEDILAFGASSSGTLDNGEVATREYIRHSGGVGIDPVVSCAMSS